MLTVTAAKAKFRRSKLKLSKTYFADDLDKIAKSRLTSKFEEELQDILFYFEKSNNYCWILTTKFILVLESGKKEKYLFSDVEKIQIPKAGQIEFNKKENDQLDLILLGGNSQLVFVEPGTWHFFYDLFRLLL